MTHKAKSPDGLDATKLNKSDGGANVEKQRDGWYDTVIDGVLTRTVQRMQNACSVWVFLLRMMSATIAQFIQLMNSVLSIRILLTMLPAFPQN